MKMSDFFELPVSVDSDGDIDTGTEEWLCLNNHNQAGYVAHAINCHDDLVNQLEESNDCMLCLVEALQDSGRSIADLMQQIKLNKEMIARARGEA